MVDRYISLGSRLGTSIWTKQFVDVKPSISNEVDNVYTKGSLLQTLTGLPVSLVSTSLRELYLCTSLSLSPPWLVTLIYPTLHGWCSWVDWDTLRHFDGTGESQQSLTLVLDPEIWAFSYSVTYFRRGSFLNTRIHFTDRSRFPLRTFHDCRLCEDLRLFSFKKSGLLHRQRWWHYVVLYQIRLVSLSNFFGVEVYVSVTPDPQVVYLNLPYTSWRVRTGEEVWEMSGLS